MKNRRIALIVLVVFFFSSCATNVVPRQPEDVLALPQTNRQEAYNTYSLELGKAGIRQAWMTRESDVAQPDKLATLLGPVSDAERFYRSGRSLQGITPWVGGASLASVGLMAIGLQNASSMKDHISNTLGGDTPQNQKVLQDSTNSAIAFGLLTAGLGIATIFLNNQANVNYKKAVDAYNYALNTTYGLGGNSSDHPVMAMLGPPRQLASASIPMVSQQTALTVPPKAFIADVDTVRQGTSPFAAKAIAVVIGNKDYKRGLAQVEYALRDAGTMKALFIDSFGLDPNDVWLYENASLADLISIFGTGENIRRSRIYRNCSLRDEPPDLFIYYSGHGAPATTGENKGKGYIVPVDADLMALSTTGYAIDDIVTNVNTMKANKVIHGAWLIFDACFSGQAGDGSHLLKAVSGLSVVPVLPKQADAGTTMMFASSGEEFASWYPDKQHGLFTYFLLKGMEGAADADQDGRLTLAEIDTYLKKNVPRFANGINGQEQTPQLFYDPASPAVLQFTR